MGRSKQSGYYYTKLVAKDLLGLLRIILQSVFLRFCGIFFMTMLFSVPLTFLSVRFGQTEATIFALLLTGVIIFMTCQFFMLRRVRYDFLSLKHYLLICFIAMALAIICHYLLYIMLDNEIYTWLFSITKFAMYREEAFSHLGSSAIFYGVISIITFYMAVDVRGYVGRFLNRW